MSTAIITLNDGIKINVKLDIDCAPISVANFISLAKANFYDGLIFHRVIKGFMIQGGGMNATMQQKQCASIKGEFASNGVDNKRKHTAGTISMARTMVPDSATSQFFICSADAPHLDGNYAAFGEVADEDSMRIVMDISKVATGTTGHHGDVPIVSIVIQSITIID